MHSMNSFSFKVSLPNSRLQDKPQKYVDKYRKIEIGTKINPKDMLESI
jgi:hypothetical protein